MSLANYAAGGIAGPVRLSRNAVHLQLPGTQGYLSLAHMPMPKWEAPVSGPRIGTIAPITDGIGMQWAPGQGGDTPGGGGAGMTFGQHVPVEVQGYKKGYIIPRSAYGAHKPGTVRW